jgi:radical SAM superfamily enzyme YgiQ (UPF0313 family)
LKILYLPSQYSQQRQKEKKRWIYPVKLAMQAQHYRNLGHHVKWGQEYGDIVDMSCLYDKVITEPENINFEHLPAPDRIFTNAFDKKYQSNGNFKYRPGTYIQVADGCWHGKCTFCVEKNNRWKVRPVWDVIQELKEIDRLGFKEVFDDSGTFPVDKWLDEFIFAMNGNNFRFKLGCNMRMVKAPWKVMKDIGFRMILFGLESVNQNTLDRIDKGTKVGDIKHIEEAAEAGLDCHIAVMFGYPWETEENAKRTLRRVHDLLKFGIAKTAQASFYTTPWGKGNEDQKGFVRRIYDVKCSPRFWINKIKDIKTKEDLNYFFRQIREGLFHG